VYRIPALKNSNRKSALDSSTRAAAYLGIECGATRTIALLAPGKNQPCRRAEFGPANLRLLDDAALLAHFTAVASLSRQTHAPLAGLAIGMAGARTETDRQRIRTAAAIVWPKVPCYATNDLETALAAVLSRGPSTNAAQVLVLSGTGSCCFGRTPDNRTAWLGGWGHILGDRGSGYQIGLRGLQAAVCHLDRAGRWSQLGQRLLQALQLNEPEDLIDWAGSASKSAIAALAMQVFEAAARRDKVAADILQAAAASLARDAALCARQLAKNGAPVRFVLAGSVLLRQPGFRRRVGSRLLEAWPRATVAPLRRESVWGALELARQHFAPGSPWKQESVPFLETALLPISRALSPTEERNPRSFKLDRMSLSQAVLLMIREESHIGPALLRVRRKIERAVALVVAAFQRGGRLFYVGAGTSGRLGILDAAECPPTFRLPPEHVQGIIAGGQTAIWSSVEGAEDSPRSGADAIKYRGVTPRDLVIGIAASGRTPFVWGALAAAKARGIPTVLLCFNPHLKIPLAVRPDLVLAADVGPEVLTGSTRLKAATATKIILNILTTLAMVRLGKVLSNLMVDLNPSNLKLRERAVRIVQAVTGADASAARAALEKSGWLVKSACHRLRSQS
jgi:N-acetylmuramic acid 6-phosphate etherase